MSAAAHQVVSVIGDVHRLLVAAAIVVEPTGLTVYSDDIARITEDVGDLADDLHDVAAGRAPRDRIDGLPSFFDKVAREYRERRTVVMPASRRKRAT